MVVTFSLPTSLVLTPPLNSPTISTPHTVTISSQKQNYAIFSETAGPIFSFYSCGILTIVRESCKNMAGVNFVTAEKISVQDSLRIVVFEAVTAGL